MPVAEIPSIILLFACLFVGPALTAQSPPEVLTPIEIDTAYIREYNNVEEMMEAETFDCFQAMNTLDGYIAWGHQLGVKKWNKWYVWDQPKLLAGINRHCDTELLWGELKDVNQSGQPELILRFKAKGYGNRGGTEEEYLQIWDTNAKALIFEGLVKDHFFWFSTKEGEELCQREVTYEAGVINVGRFNCNEGTQHKRYVKDSVDIRYTLVEGQFKRN